ncbi:MAG TPA: DUF3224 domain-containing protein [Polyangiaceae bacterium]|jgi:hypothetical protein|nr:DUF3224 domain-containing protein [Polyangiaceae bacterium]
MLLPALVGSAACAPQTPPPALPVLGVPPPPRDATNDAATLTVNHKRRAVAYTAVTAYTPTTFDDLPDAPVLVDVQLTETFSGDIEGQGIARVIQATHHDGSAAFAGFERVRGSIAERKGTFVLQVRGTVAGRAMNAEWFVVPGSGTGDLTGLNGAGGFKADVGQQGKVWLDYFFE